MGNAQSQAQDKLALILPEKDTWNDDYWGSSKKIKPFRDSKDREQFIHALLTLLSNNGTFWLEAHDFRLLYSRRNNDRFLATLVAIKKVSGVIEAKIEPIEDGANQAEAFLAFKKYVELRLTDVLGGVPDFAGKSPGEGPSTSGVPNDKPPAYDGSVTGLESNGKKSTSKR